MTVDVVLAATVMAATVMAATVMVFVSRGSEQRYNYLDLKLVELLHLTTFVEFCLQLCSALSFESQLSFAIHHLARWSHLQLS